MRMLLRGWFVPLALAVLPAQGGAQGLPQGRPEPLGFSPEGLAGVTRVVQAHVDSGLVAGAAFVVARHGQVVWRGAVGAMDVETDEPMRSDAIFRICSMSKPVTAVAAMQLVERGQIALDDPLSKYLPAFAHVKVFVGGSSTSPELRDPTRPIRIADLMLHTSGFGPRFPSRSEPIDSLWDLSRLLVWERPLGDFADAVAHLPLFFSPGEQWQYSLGLEVLGRVIEVVSGKSFDEYLREELFGPLGMTQTGFVLSQGGAPLVPQLYDRAGPGEPLRRSQDTTCGTYAPDTRYFSGGGGLLSTMDDYLRFAQMLLEGGELDGRRVLSQQSVALITQNRLDQSFLPLPLPTFLGRPGQPGYGQGLGGAVLVDPSATDIPGPAGIYRWLGYYSTYFWIDPENDLVGMVWAQFRPDAETSIGLDPAFQRAVYQALVPPGLGRVPGAP